MNRYEIAMDFKKKFIEENENVCSKTVKPTYISINGNEAKVSTNPYTIETAEHGLVILHYNYTVITQTDSSVATLFFNSNGDIEDYIEIDGWKLNFDKPKTALWRSNGIGCHISNGVLKLDFSITYPWMIDEKFDRIWKLFSIARTCETQKEIDLAYKVYTSRDELLSLKEKCFKDEVKIDELRILLEVHKDFVEKLKEIVKQ